MDLSASPSPFPALTLSTVLRSLGAAVAGWGVSRRLHQVMANFLVDRVREACFRMERLAARFAAGTLPVARVVERKVVEAPVEAPARVVRARVVPVRFGWLVKHMTWHAAVYSGQLRQVLIEPEMVALLTACPQARRILTPICRMLAVETALLRPGVVAPVREPRPKAPRKKRPSDLIYYPPRGGPGLGCPSTLVINRRTGHVRYKLPWHKR